MCERGVYNDEAEVTPPVTCMTVTNNYAAHSLASLFPLSSYYEPIGVNYLKSIYKMSVTGVRNMCLQRK